jgi:hypothetical protein
LNCRRKGKNTPAKDADGEADAVREGLGENAVWDGVGVYEGDALPEGVYVPEPVAEGVAGGEPGLRGREAVAAAEWLPLGVATAVLVPLAEADEPDPDGDGEATAGDTVPVMVAEAEAGELLELAVPLAETALPESVTVELAAAEAVPDAVAEMRVPDGEIVGLPDTPAGEAEADAAMEVDGDTNGEPAAEGLAEAGMYCWGAAHTMAGSGQVMLFM